jgi:ketosteroid isomerase-like protein
VDGQQGLANVRNIRRNPIEVAVMSNIPTVQAIYQCFGQGDVPGILAHVASDVAWDHWRDNSSQKAGVPWMRAGTGHEAAIGFFTALNEAMEFKAFDVQNLMEGGNQVAATVSIDVVSRASGEPSSDEEVHLFTFNDEGKVSAFRHYGDTVKQLQMAGLS